MIVQAIPRDVWGWRGTAVVVAVVTLPLLLALQLGPGAARTTVLAAHSGLTTYLIGLCTALLLYVHWRMSGGTAVAWLVAGVATVAVQGIAHEAQLVSDRDRLMADQGWVLLVHLVLALGLLAMSPLARRVRLRVDPLALGLGLGASVATLRWALADLAPPLTTVPGTLQALNLSVLAVGLAVAVTTCRTSSVPGWVRIRLGGAVALLTLSHTMLHGPVDGLPNVVAIVCDVTAGVVLTSTSFALLRTSIQQSQARLARLEGRLAEVEADVRTDRARLHEIGATVAGIASASRIIHTAPELPDGKRDVLEEMLRSETARLERMLAARTPQPPGSYAGSSAGQIDVDEAIRPVVVRQEARGVGVDWRPSAVHARGRLDDVTEVVGILLENATHHAGGEGVAVTVRAREEAVEIVVSDRGPGIPSDVRLFDWGARGPGSTGQGIGLHVARQLMVQQGGYLRLVDQQGAGTTFVVGLPAIGARRVAVA